MKKILTCLLQYGGYFPFEAIAVKFMAPQMLCGILRTLPWDCTMLMNQDGDSN